jgi:hypothetical protein
MWSEIIETLELFRITLLRYPFFFLSVNTLYSRLVFHLLIESERLMMSSWGLRLLVAALKVFISLNNRLPARLENWRWRFAAHTYRSRAILLFLWLDMWDCIFKLLIIILVAFFFWILCMVSLDIVVVHLLHRHYSRTICFFDINDIVGRFIARIRSAWLRSLVFVLIFDRWLTERGMSSLLVTTAVRPHFCN